MLFAVTALASVFFVVSKPVLATEKTCAGEKSYPLFQLVSFKDEAATKNFSDNLKHDLGAITLLEFFTDEKGSGVRFKDIKRSSNVLENAIDRLYFSCAKSVAGSDCWKVRQTIVKNLLIKTKTTRYSILAAPDGTLVLNISFLHDYGGDVPFRATQVRFVQNPHTQCFQPQLIRGEIKSYLPFNLMTINIRAAMSGGGVKNASIWQMDEAHFESDGVLKTAPRFLDHAPLK